MYFYFQLRQNIEHVVMVTGDVPESPNGLLYNTFLLSVIKHVGEGGNGGSPRQEEEILIKL